MLNCSCRHLSEVMLIRLSTVLDPGALKIFFYSAGSIIQFEFDSIEFLQLAKCIIKVLLTLNDFVLAMILSIAWLIVQKAFLEMTSLSKESCVNVLLIEVQNIRFLDMSLLKYSK